MSTPVFHTAGGRATGYRGSHAGGVIVHPTMPNWFVFIPDTINASPEIMDAAGYAPAGGYVATPRDALRDLWDALDSPIKQAVEYLLKDGRKIAAIKLARHISGCGLSEARRMVEDFAAKVTFA